MHDRRTSALRARPHRRDLGPGTQRPLADGSRTARSTGIMRALFSDYFCPITVVQQTPEQMSTPCGAAERAAIRPGRGQSPAQQARTSSHPGCRQRRGLLRQPAARPTPATATARHRMISDRFIIEFDKALRTLCAPASTVREVPGSQRARSSHVGSREDPCRQP
jgi:hypothetical protein